MEIDPKIIEDLADLGFYYTARGEVNNTFELTPNSGNYYRISQAYWPNGAPQGVSTNISGLPSWSYFLEGQGRMTPITASSGQNPLSSTSYDGIGPMGVTFGSGDSDRATAMIRAPVARRPMDLR